MKTDKEKQKLIGAVKSLRLEKFHFQERRGRFDENLLFTQTFSFNFAGGIIEQAFQKPDGSVQQTLYDYSADGKSLAQSYDSSGILTNQVKYFYQDGRLISEQSIAQDGQINLQTNYSYQNDKTKVKAQVFLGFTETSVGLSFEETNTGILAHDVKVVKTFYDQNDNVFEIKVYNSQDALISRVEIVRNPNGKPLEEIQYIGEVIEFTPFDPDSVAAQKLAQLTEEERRAAENESLQIFAPGKVLSRNIHQYDEAGRLIESKKMMMDLETDRQTFSYDGRGRKFEEISFQAGRSSKNIFTYQDDQQGNWTREIISTVTDKNGNEQVIPLSETRRSFVYFSAE